MNVNWIEARYGSRKGLVLTAWHQLLNVFGLYKPDDIPWNTIERFVFVCSGNICRSAFAEAVAKSIGIHAISVGIHAIENAPANMQAIITAKKLGYSLDEHRTTPIMYPLLKKTDLLIAMEPWQAKLVAQNLSRRSYATLLGLWGKPARPYISDPYNRSPEYFEKCFNYIEKSVHAIAAKLSTQS